ncbi:MAG: hypothetical protein ACW960_06010 [Candidatus Thorarchaeota archaeon]|jgi:hypothetical protein
MDTLDFSRGIFASTSVDTASSMKLRKQLKKSMRRMISQLKSMSDHLEGMTDVVVEATVTDAVAEATATGIDVAVDIEIATAIVDTRVCFNQRHRRGLCPSLKPLFSSLFIKTHSSRQAVPS